MSLSRKSELILDLLHPKQIEDITPADEEEEDNGGMTAEEARELEDLLSDSE